MKIFFGIRRIAVITISGAVLALGLVSAVASTPALASSCTYANGIIPTPTSHYNVSWTNGNETRHIELWYSTSSACVWGYEYNGQPGDIVWVYNDVTGVTNSITIPSGHHTGTTGLIGDSGTESHACMSPHLSNGSYGPKTCTYYY